MASKIALTAALLVLALVVFATATTYTTTSYEDDSQGGKQMQQCQSQLQGKQFHSCQDYFKQGSQSQYDMEPLEMIVEEPYQKQQQGSQMQRERCCEQLRNVDPQCRCEAINIALKHSGSFRGQQMQQVWQKAQNLPQKCNFRRGPQQCQFRAIFI